MYDIIRAKYRFKSGRFDYASFLKEEYDMDSNSRFIKNAKDFSSLLQDPEVEGPFKHLYGSEQDIRFIQQVLKRFRWKI